MEFHEVLNEGQKNKSKTFNLISLELDFIVVGVVQKPFPGVSVLPNYVDPHF